MKPTIGRVVHYRLSESDVQEIASKGHAPHEERNPVEAAEVYPAVIVRVFDDEPDYCNLQVLLDGDVQYWATSRTEGDGPGEWFWPPRV